MKLRTRLLLGFTIVFIVVLAAGVFTVVSQRNQLYDQVDDQLMSTPLPLGTRIDRAGGPGAPRPEPVDNESISDLYAAVLGLDGELRALIEGQLLTDVPDLQHFVDNPPTAAAMFSADGVDGMSTFRVRFVPADDVSLATFVAIPIDEVNDTIRQLTFTFVGVGAVVLLALVLIASWVNRFGLRPIGEMTDVADAISSGDRERRAPYDDSTEAGRLGHAFNMMLDERDTTETRLRQFVSNASHELRTPLTSIRGYLDLYAAGGFRKPGELDDAIRRLRVEAERMNLLVEDLLVLAKFDEEQPLDLATVRVDEIVGDVAALSQAAHPGRVISIDAPQPLDATADRLRLHQALAALVDNAVRHTPDDTPVLVSATRSASGIDLAVSDTGPGLTEGEAAAVFDRFSRGDPSRARKNGGSGLGLSITQAIVHAHGGEISVTATPGEGATFTISLPD